MAVTFKLNDKDGRLFHFYTRSKKTYERKSWVQFYKGWHGITLMFELAGYFDNRMGLHISFGWGQFFIDLPFYTKYDECDPPKYGIYYYENSFWLCYGRKIKCIHMPWQYDWVRTSLLLKDEKTWEHETKGNHKSFYKDEWKDKMFTQTWPYKYILKSGEIQTVNATIRVEEREWRPRWFRCTSLFRKVNKSINVDFDGEVGERAGSWKGGTTGCGYDVLPNESPAETLFRMERERKFN